MGLEPVIWGLWVLQAIAVTVLALYTAFNRRWFAAMGAVGGLIVGFLPFFMMRGQGPAVFGPAVLIVLVSTVALIVAYGINMRWLALILTMLLLAAPLGYMLFVYRSFPPELNPLLTPLAVIGQTTYLLGPITCALACREIFGWVDRLLSRRRAT